MELHEFSHLSPLESERIPCNHCDLLFQNVQLWEDHKRKISKRKRKKESRICEICGKILSSPGSLEGHMRIHTGDRTFACTTCPKVLTTLQGLAVHMRSHTGERPYKCNICGKGFMDGSTLRVHGRQHTGESPYVCQLCGKACKQRQNLKSHMRHMHTVLDAHQRALSTIEQV